MNGNGNPFDYQTFLLTTLFDQLDYSEQLNNVTFNNDYVNYTPLTGDEIGEMYSYMSNVTETCRFILDQFYRYTTSTYE